MSKAIDHRDRARGAVGDPEVCPELLSVYAVAGILNCSHRHVYRLSDEGRMPAPVRLGGLVRWNRKAVLDWIAAGCPAVLPKGGAR